jgi:hypothetical protein
MRKTPLLERTTITFGREGQQVTARIDGPRLRPSRPARPNPDPYQELVIAIGDRGLACGIERERGYDPYVWAQLPGGGRLLVFKPVDMDPQPPNAWRAVISGPGEPQPFLWDSTEEGPDRGAAFEQMLHAISRFLDHQDVDTRQDTRPVLNESAVASILHRAGFVAVQDGPERYLRLPLGMTDEAEQRRAVSRALGELRFEGFEVVCPPALVDERAPSGVGFDPDLRHLAGRLATAVTEAQHSRDLVAALSEITAPQDGLLHQSAATLRATADWWGPLDSAGAEHLRQLARQLDGVALAARDATAVLTDRHTTRPAGRSNARAAAARHGPAAGTQHADPPLLPAPSTGSATPAPTRPHRPGT